MNDDFKTVKEYIRQSSTKSGIYIGCDSKKYRRGNKMFVAYVGVVVIHYDCNKGGKIFKFIRKEPDYGNLKQRLLNEVMMACEIGYNLIDTIGERPFEVHLDINPNPKHKSSIAVKEAIGYVLGTFGFKPKLKPESFASSSVADKYVVTLTNKEYYKYQKEHKQKIQ